MAEPAKKNWTFLETTRTLILKPSVRPEERKASQESRIVCERRKVGKRVQKGKIPTYMNTLSTLTALALGCDVEKPVDNSERLLKLNTFDCHSSSDAWRQTVLLLHFFRFPCLVFFVKMLDSHCFIFFRDVVINQGSHSRTNVCLLI